MQEDQSLQSYKNISELYYYTINLTFTILLNQINVHFVGKIINSTLAGACFQLKRTKIR